MQSEPPLVKINFLDKLKQRLRILSKKYLQIAIVTSLCNDKP